MKREPVIHHMIYAMLKSRFQNSEPKLLNYRDLKSFSPQTFEEDLSEPLIVIIQMINLKMFLLQS